jgi:hypothetical protein
MANSERPPEFYINKKWDKCIDLALRRVVYGTLGGGAVALILFSEPRSYDPMPQYSMRLRPLEDACRPSIPTIAFSSQVYEVWMK